MYVVANDMITEALMN